jgi:hypothetical protein
MTSLPTCPWKLNDVTWESWGVRIQISSNRAHKGRSKVESVLCCDERQVFRTLSLCRNNCYWRHSPRLARRQICDDGDRDVFRNFDLFLRFGRLVDREDFIKFSRREKSDLACWNITSSLICKKKVPVPCVWTRWCLDYLRRLLPFVQENFPETRAWRSEQFEWHSFISDGVS